ncbi:MAG TPA: nucleotidyltransferase family protein [Marmoricola sp.]|nr:nucleotidyltransferase family protein [Marmoricola sp.]
MAVVGIVLAAGAGSRFGSPKATVVEAGRSWLARAVESLRGGGCDDVVVVLGAEADRARTLVADDVRVVVADDWIDGLSASLRRGLGAIADDAPAVDRASITLVDLPDVGADVVARLLARGGGETALVRASYDGRPGHPVVLGRAHWDGVRDSVSGDRGAGDYLVEHGATLVECSDLATGADLDAPR